MWQRLRARKVRVFHDHGGLDDAPRVFIEAPAEHLAKLRPQEESGGGRVCSNEAFPVVMNECEQVLALLRREVYLTDTDKEDCIEVVEVLGVKARGTVAREHFALS